MADDKPGLAALIMADDDKKPEDSGDDSSSSFDSAIEDFKSAMKSGDNEAIKSAFQDCVALCNKDYSSDDEE